MTLPAGTRLARYRIESLLGSGGMGEVYKAHDDALGRPVAIKIVRQDLALDPLRLHRLASEAKTASAMNHPHIVHVYDVGAAAGVHFIAMEYVAGTTLRRLMADRAPLITLLRYLDQVADALAKAHAAGIIHRDLKPDNILISKDGYAKVADFGLAKLRRPEQLESDSTAPLTAAGVIVGTPGYIAPEQILGQEIDHRADIFSFGCILHEAIGGRRAFTASSEFELMKRMAYDSPEPLPPSTLPSLQEIVARCLEKNPSRRYESLEKVSAELRNVIRRLESESDLPTEHAVRPSMPRPARARLPLLLLLLAVVAAGSIAFVASRREARVPADSPAPATAVVQPSRTPRDDFMRAKVLISEQNATSNERAIQLLDAVVAADPEFAPAYAALARAYTIKAFAFAAEAERGKYNEEAAVAVEKAMALDPNLAEAHLARGVFLWSHQNGFPHEEAAGALQRAIAIKPSLDDAHHDLGQIYLHVGLLDKAEQHLRIAIRENPGNLQARYRTGTVQLLRGECMDALRIFRSTPLTKNPPIVTWATASALVCLNRDDEALQLIDGFLREQLRDEGGLASGLTAMIHARNGRTALAEEAIARAIASGKGYGHFHHAAFNVGCAYALLNRPVEAVRWLREAVNDGFPCHPAFVNEKTLDGIRNHPAFLALMRELEKEHERRLRTM